jgi:hypothetical protein
MKSKCFKTSVHGIDCYVYAENASKARYSTYLHANESGYYCKITQIRSVRASDFDRDLIMPCSRKISPMNGYSLDFVSNPCNCNICLGLMTR